MQFYYQRSIPPNFQIDFTLAHIGNPSLSEINAKIDAILEEEPSDNHFSTSDLDAKVKVVLRNLLRLNVSNQFSQYKELTQLLQTSQFKLNDYTSLSQTISRLWAEKIENPYFPLQAYWEAIKPLLHPQCLKTTQQQHHQALLYAISKTQNQAEVENFIELFGFNCTQGNLIGNQYDAMSSPLSGAIYGGNKEVVQFFLSKLPARSTLAPYRHLLSALEAGYNSASIDGTEETIQSYLAIFNLLIDYKADHNFLNHCEFYEGNTLSSLSLLNLVPRLNEAKNPDLLKQLINDFNIKHISSDVTWRQKIIRAMPSSDIQKLPQFFVKHVFLTPLLLVCMEKLANTPQPHWLWIGGSFAKGVEEDASISELQDAIAHLITSSPDQRLNAKVISYIAHSYNEIVFIAHLHKLAQWQQKEWLIDDLRIWGSRAAADCKSQKEIEQQFDKKDMIADRDIYDRFPIIEQKAREQQMENFEAKVFALTVLFCDEYLSFAPD
jgi:hypothetical protein